MLRAAFARICCACTRKCLVSAAVTVLVPVVFSVPVIVYPDMVRSPPFMSFAVFGTSITILLNYPVVISTMHQAPMYLDTAFTECPRGERFRRIFTRVLTVSTSLAAVLVTNYTIFRYHESVLSPFETIGVMGGALSLLGRCHKMLGCITLRFLRSRAGAYEQDPPFSPQDQKNAEADSTQA